MKKIIFFSFLLIGIVLTSCSSDEPNSSILSNGTVEMDPFGGENFVYVSYAGSWSFQYEEEWLTVRKNQNGLRIIAEENATTEGRKASVGIYSDNAKIATLTVIQMPIVAVNGGDEVSLPFYASRHSVKHNFKSDPEIELSDEWCTAECIGDSIIIYADKNYELKSRKSQIKLNYNGYSKEISVVQKECPWYESFKMIPVDGGYFYMGAQSYDMYSTNYDKDAFSVESPVHWVEISDYYIGAFEVTQEQWIAAMGSNPSVSQLGGKYPVENVSWEDVQLFISKLCHASGKNYRLPTEAEWEYAAKGGDRHDSYLYSGSNMPSSVGWFYSNSNSSIHEVGLKTPNSLGIYDMTGNVSEWVSDWFALYEDDYWYGYTGPSTGELKINRGGSCNSASSNCRNTYRNMNAPSEKSEEIGFRLVLIP